MVKIPKPPDEPPPEYRGLRDPKEPRYDIHAPLPDKDFWFGVAVAVTLAVVIGVAVWWWFWG